MYRPRGRLLVLDVFWGLDRGYMGERGILSEWLGEEIKQMKTDGLYKMDGWGSKRIHITNFLFIHREKGLFVFNKSFLIDQNLFSLTL